MHPALKIFLVIVLVGLYLLGAYFYEVKFLGMVVGWYFQLLEMRSGLSMHEAFWYAMWVIGTTLIAVPHLAWAPVYVIKELVALFRSYEHSKPYVSRAYVMRHA